MLTQHKAARKYMQEKENKVFVQFTLNLQFKVKHLNLHQMAD